ncbi:MAG: hypothetical protein ACYTGZ_04815 [Planctomycetota bacterium]
MRSLLLVALLAASAEAEVWEPLHDYVRRCSLIVRARAIVPEKGGLRFKVLESWKGKYDTSLFFDFCVNDAGEYLSRAGEHGIDVVDGQEIVFFFSRPKKGEKFGPHTTSFPVVKNTVLYASTSEDDELQKRWHIGEFKKRIRALSLPLATSADKKFRLQCLAIERVGAKATLRFIVESAELSWHPTRFLFAEGAVRVEKGPLKLSMVHADVGGELELRGKTDAANLDGLVIEFGILRVKDVKWHRLDKIALGKSAPLVAGPFRVHVEAEKESAMVVCGLARHRPVQELDVRWLFAALRIEDHKFQRLVERESGGSHRGGAAGFALEPKGALAYPLSLAVPVPAKVERERVRFEFARFALPK